MAQLRGLFFTWVIGALIAATSSDADAKVLLFTELARWQAAVRAEEVFLMTGPNIELANEVTVPPISGVPLGDTLTFLASTTGFARDFSVKAFTPGQEWFFTLMSDDIGSDISPGAPAGAGVSPDDDDWQISILNGETISAFGLELRDNDATQDETLVLLAADGTVLATIDTSVLPENGDPDYDPFQFVGVVADFDFAQIRFDESSTDSGDDIAIAHFRFATSITPVGTQGVLEVPLPPYSVQSGAGFISGWYCNLPETEIMTVRFDDGSPIHVLYGASREDTRPVCGSANNGYVMPWNWNLLGDGLHTLEVFAGNVLVDSVEVWVNTFGVEFLTGADATCTVEGFPEAGRRAILEWQENSQNFSITQVD